MNDSLIVAFAPCPMICTPLPLEYSEEDNDWAPVSLKSEPATLWLTQFCSLEILRKTENIPKGYSRGSQMFWDGN